MAPFDVVVTSYNDDPRYSQFVPLVRHAWDRWFPEVRFEAHHTSAGANWAKLLRYHAAADCARDEVVLIHDIDTVPLQREYYVNLTAQRRPGHLLCVGAEVYAETEDCGKFPAGCMTGEARLFRELCDAQAVLDDTKADSLLPPDGFSDESWVRSRLASGRIAEQHVGRNVDIYTQWVDRSWWHLLNQYWLRAGHYIECNMLRPWSENIEAMRPIVEYLGYEGPLPCSE